MTRRRSVPGKVAAALSLVPAATGLAVTGALADTGASAGTAANAAVSVAAADTGCGKAPGLASGTHRIRSGGKDRSFVLEVPGDYDKSRPYRLILAFHPRGGTAAEVASGGTSGASWAYHGQEELSDGSAILVAPQCIDNAWPDNGGEDVAFVDAVAPRVEAALCVDPAQRFAAGFDHGVGSALACGRADVFRAVAVFSGARSSGCDGGSRPDAYLGVQGAGAEDEVWKFFSRFGDTSSEPTVMSAPLKFTCRVADTVTAWDSGLNSQITITYTGVAPVRGWSLTFTPPAGQTITTGWNASYSTTSGQVTATNAPYNGDLDGGGSVSIGFQASHTGDLGEPAYFTLNGATCAND